MTYRDQSHMRPLVRIFDTASQGISPGSSVHPRGALLLATTTPQAPSASICITRPEFMPRTYVRGGKCAA